MNDEIKPGGRLMPLHIYWVGPHYVIYEVSLGGLTYMGSFSETAFLEWLRLNVEDRSRKQREAHQAEAQRAKHTPLNIKLEL